MDPRFWNVDDQSARAHSRIRNMVGRATLTKIDDTQAAQLLQVEAHNTEVRDNLQRLGNVGHGSVPLPGASAIILWPNGHRGYGVVVGIEDGRYRARGYQGGEAHFTMIDGAKPDGTGGTLRKLAEGLLGWIHNIYGTLISIGTKADTKTIIITAGDSITITCATAIKLDGPVEITGDLTVDGKVVDKGDLSIGGTETGGGTA